MLLRRIPIFPWLLWLRFWLSLLALSSPSFVFFSGVLRGGRRLVLGTGLRITVRWRWLFALPLLALGLAVTMPSAALFFYQRFTTLAALLALARFALVFAVLLLWIGLVLVRLCGLLVGASLLTALSYCPRNGGFLRGIHADIGFTSEGLPLI